MSSRLALAAVLLGVTPVAADPNTPAPGTRFELRIDSKLETTVGDQNVPIATEAVVRYAWNTGGRKRTLTVESIEVKATQGGKMTLSAVMSADEFVDRTTAPPSRIKTADAPEQLRQMLTESFGPVLCTVEVDDSGKETKRTVTDKPGTGLMIENGMVANGLLMHPPRPGAAEWKAEREVSMGEGGYATGELTYTPQPGGRVGEAVVKVAGVLKKDRHVPKGGMKVIKNARYVVSGTQTYSTTKGEWVAGKLMLEVTFDVEAAGVTGTAKGTMVVTMKAR